MIAKIKKSLYFPIASYFRFFAAIRLRKWNPKIVLVTGSSGKTTLLHLLESQIGDKAKYSHHANSSYGIPFDILGIQRKSLLKSEWISLFLKAPFMVFAKSPKEKIYIVEADCDRPGEGKFLASFINPEIVLWVSTSNTHSVNFDKLVSSRHPRLDRGSMDSRLRGNDKVNKFESVQEAIAYEFGYFLEYAKDLVMVNGDSELMNTQVKRTKAKIVTINKKEVLKSYKVSKEGTEFNFVPTTNNSKALHTRDTPDTLDTFVFKFLLPEEVFYSIQMCQKICEILNIFFDQSFSNFKIPPGRGSIFDGIKDTIILDSSYNATPSSVKTILSMFNQIKADKKWLVIGDMIELGKSEKEEHENLAQQIMDCRFEKLILMGPRVSKYTYPILMSLRVHSINSVRSNLKGGIATSPLAPRNDDDIIKFQGPKETLDYMRENIKGKEVILFKGARFMEGIIEHLLKNKEDIDLLPRREKIWEIRRKQWGL